MTKIKYLMQWFGEKKLEIKDSGIPETLTPFELANIGNEDTPPP